MNLNMEIYDLVYILLGILVALVIGVMLLLRRRRKSDQQSSIPGVEEMAKTALFWSEYHRGRVGQEDEDK